MGDQLARNCTSAWSCHDMHDDYSQLVSPVFDSLVLDTWNCGLEEPLEGTIFVR